VQREFGLHFNVGRHGAVPIRKIIVKWVDSFQTTETQIIIGSVGNDTATPDVEVKSEL